jgi:hypothetical protein
MINPCKQCIVQAMCQDPCRNFVVYLTSHDFIAIEMTEMAKHYPTSFHRMAVFIKRDTDANGSVHSKLWDLKEDIKKRGII